MTSTNLGIFNLDLQLYFMGEINYEVTMVPPVATAVKNRNITKSQKFEQNAAATPQINWIITAHTIGSLRPNL
jgi:hypothetical protein